MEINQGMASILLCPDLGLLFACWAPGFALLKVINSNSTSICLTDESVALFRRLDKPGLKDD
jgi:hypothetical protein